MPFFFLSTFHGPLATKYCTLFHVAFYLIRPDEGETSPKRKKKNTSPNQHTRTSSSTFQHSGVYDVVLTVPRLYCTRIMLIELNEEQNLKTSLLYLLLFLFLRKMQKRQLSLPPCFEFSLKKGF